MELQITEQPDGQWRVTQDGGHILIPSGSLAMELGERWLILVGTSANVRITHLDGRVEFMREDDR